MTTLAGAPCWIDLTTTDLRAAITFYRELFGWTVLEGGPEYGGYVQFLLDGAPVGGGMSAPDEEHPNAWSVYLRTDDIQATSAAVAVHGGQVVVEPMPVGDLGWMAGYLDATEAFVGAWQPISFVGTQATGFGAPSWHELWAKDYPAAVDFYEKVFDWDVSVMADTDEFRYGTLGSGDDARAGIFDVAAALPELVPSYLLVYLRVADADAACARAVELGGEVLRPAETTPYGRLATIADPTGAVFTVQQVLA